MNVIERARTAAGLSVQALADLAHTSRPTVSAYIHGSKSPRLDTVERIVGAAGHTLEVVRCPRFSPIEFRGRTFWVPDALIRLDPHLAIACVELPLHLRWSGNRLYDLADRYDRARVYETVIREGTPNDLERYVDGALLIAVWDDLVLPGPVRLAWQELVDKTRFADE